MRTFHGLLLLSLLVGGCAGLDSGGPTATMQGTPQPTGAEDVVPADLLPMAGPETIVLSVSFYRLIAVNGETGEANAVLSSKRSDEELQAILQGMNAIWGQANIQFEARYTGPLDVPEDVLVGIIARDFGPFFAQAGSTFLLPEPAMLHGFYAGDIGGPNGITPYGTRAYFVTDRPTVLDARVSSHEVGHILGLTHILSDPEHLLSPGTNGTLLDADEIAAARRAAQAIAEGGDVR